MKILILNGPNLNLLGSREPDIYGRKGLRDIEKSTQEALSDLSLDLEWRQSNSLEKLIDWIHGAHDEGFEAIIINPGGLTHTSVALHDAMLCFEGKKVEVHLSNTYKREAFRNIKLTSKACDGVIEGFGPLGYELALRSVVA